MTNFKLGGCKMSNSKEDPSGKNRYSFLFNQKDLGATLDYVHGHILDRVEKLRGNVQRACSLKPDNADNQLAEKILRTLDLGINAAIAPVHNTKIDDAHLHEESNGYRP